MSNSVEGEVETVGLRAAIARVVRNHELVGAEIVGISDSAGRVMNSTTARPAPWPSYRDEAQPAKSDTTVRSPRLPFRWRSGKEVVMPAQERPTHWIDRGRNTRYKVCRGVPASRSVDLRGTRSLDLPDYVNTIPIG